MRAPGVIAPRANRLPRPRTIVWRVVRLACAAVLLTGSAPGVAYAERTVGLSSGSFEFAVAAGGEGDGQLTVYNNGDEPLKVLVYSANQVVAEDGSITYVLPERTGSLGTPASWLSFKVGKQLKARSNTPYLELEPAEQVPVDFTFEVPDNAPAGDHQVLLFFEMVSDADLESGSSSVAGRIGARIRIRVQGEIVERVEVDPFVTRTFTVGDKVPYTFDVVNAGNTDKVVAATLRLISGSGRPVAASSIETAAPVYAGTSIERTGNLSLAGFALGKYTLAVDVEYPRDGGGSSVPQVLSVERTVWIIPLWLALAVVVAAVVGIGLARRRPRVATVNVDSSRHRRRSGGAHRAGGRQSGSDS